MLSKILSFLTITSFTFALPLLTSRDDPLVTITLIDATQNSYPVTIPSTQIWTPTNVIQSISHVTIENTGYVPCTFFGVDGAEIVSLPGDVKSIDVGPPQMIVGGICGPCTWDERVIA